MPSKTDVGAIREAVRRLFCKNHCIDLIRRVIWTDAWEWEHHNECRSCGAFVSIHSICKALPESVTYSTLVKRPRKFCIPVEVSWFPGDPHKENSGIVNLCDTRKARAPVQYKTFGPVAPRICPRCETKLKDMVRRWRRRVADQFEAKATIQVQVVRPVQSKDQAGCGVLGRYEDR